MNRDKSAVDRPWNRKFLGFSFLSNRQATIRLASKTISRFKEKIKELTSRTWSISMEDRITRINRYLMGWIGYFRLASAKNHCERFDQWIRRRLCMCLWKRVQTRLRELRALGVPDWAAWSMANSRRGAWEMSRNTNNAFPTSYWEARGLKSLLSRYLEFCQPFGTAVCGPACTVVRGRGLAAPSYLIDFASAFRPGSRIVRSACSAMFSIWPARPS